MIKIKEKHIKEVIKFYKINSEVENIDFLCEIYNEKENRVRVICQVELKNSSRYIIKFVQEKEYPHKLMEEQSIFSEVLRNSGINTAKMLKCDEGYCYLYNLENLNLTVTLQEYLGDALTIINEKLVKEIAALMAKMHRVSEDNKCHIHNDTIWSLWKYDSDIMRGYVEFKNLHDKIIKIDKDLEETYENIINLYEKRRGNIDKLKDKLPRYATQGDYSTNNLTFENKEIGVFDYNISGDEFLINDMVIEGLFVAKVMDLDKGLNDKDRDMLFRLFVDTYRGFRELNIYEAKVMNDIYAVVVPFWWSRIIFEEEGSLSYIIKNKNRKALKEFLNETYSILNSNYFD